MALDKIKTDVIADNAVTSAKLPDGGVAIADLATDTGITTNYHKVPAFADDAARNTAISSPAVGMLVYNTDKGVIQQYNSQGWASVDSPPTVSSLDYPGSSSALDPVGEYTDATCDYNNDATITHDTNTKMRAGMTVKGTGIPTGATIASVTSNTEFELSAPTTGGAVTNGTLTFNTETLIIAGTNFQTGLSVTVDNTAPSTVTRNSSTQITCTGMPAKTAGTYIDGLKVTNPTGLAASINVDYSGTPAWTTASGNLLNDFQGTISEIDLVATGDAPITYAITSGALPTGLSMATADGDITGNMTAAAATYNFTVTATDAQTQTTPRLFNIISKGAAPSGGDTGGAGTPTNAYAVYNDGTNDYRVHRFTSSGDFVLPAAEDIDIMVIGGGGGASFGGGGAGALVWTPSLSLSAATYAIVIGAGGLGVRHSARQSDSAEGIGDDSSFGGTGNSWSILAKGGGYGGGPTQNTGHGGDGGCGGGGGHASSGGTNANGGAAVTTNDVPTGGTAYGYAGSRSYNFNAAGSGWSGANSTQYWGAGGGGTSGTVPPLGGTGNENSYIIAYKPWEVGTNDNGTQGMNGHSTFITNNTLTSKFLYAADAGTNASNAATSTLSSDPGTLYIGGGGGGAYGNAAGGLGGGGQSYTSTTTGQVGMANTGSGGGGSNGQGNDGGAGLVLIRYVI